MGLFKKIFNNGKICVVAEKHSVALDYSKALNCKRYDGYFEGKNHVIVWTDGHICTLYSPEDYDKKYKVWSMEDLPIDPNGLWVKVRKGKEYKMKTIKSVIEREDITKVCIATDSAREGNLIGEYLLKAIGNKKPVYRAMIATSQEKEILSGFKNMKSDSFYKGMTEAAQTRDEIDWLIGCNFSRAYSLLNKKRYYVGRCKTVILNLLFEKEREISNTKQKLYYTVTGEFKSKKGVEYCGALDMEVTSESEAEKIKKKKAVQGQKGEIVSITKEIKIIEPEKLYDLNELIIAASRRSGCSSEDTYNIAQKLYEEYKLITYARTDTRYVKESMVESLKETVFSLKSSKVAEISNLNDMSLFKRRCVNDVEVTEHPAITPLKLENQVLEETYKSLAKSEKDIYDLIVDNFVSNFLGDYVYESYKIETDVNGYKFVTNKHKVLSAGWRVGQVDHGDMELLENEEIECLKINTEKKLSKLPSRYNDASLFVILGNPARFVEDKGHKEILKKQGIGTVATRALLLRDIINQGYVEREGKYIFPTIDGQGLISSIKTDKLKEPYFTAEIEEQLQLIESGKETKDKVINNVRGFIRQHIDELMLSCEETEKTEVFGACPKCKSGKIVSAGEKGYGCTNLKINGCRFYVSKTVLGTTIEKIQLKKLISNNETDILSFIGKKGTFKAKIILDKEKNTKFKY